jgi:hypothetical protein
VIIDGCDTGVANVFVGPGCTIGDRIAECLASAANHDEFVAATARLTNDLRKQGQLTDRQKGRIQSCVAKSNRP